MSERKCILILFDYSMVVKAVYELTIYRLSEEMCSFAHTDLCFVVNLKLADAPLCSLLDVFTVRSCALYG